jgi:hypothetical protein
MTRKDTELIAAALFEAKAGMETVSIVADKLAMTNPRFDRSRFIRAASGDRR